MVRVLSIDPGKRNMALCVLEVGQQADVIVHWAVIEVSTDDPRLLAEALTRELAGVQFDEVVVERQPAKNPSMRRVETWMAMYFAMARPDVECRSMHARTKLAFASRTPQWPPGGCDITTYAGRKQTAVRVAESVVKTQPEPMRAIFAAAKKKDDLADALLQCMGWAHRDTVPAYVKAFPKPRKPTARQAGGRYSASNVVHFLKDRATEAEIAAFLNTDARASRALKKYFGTPASFLQQLKSSAGHDPHASRIRNVEADQAAPE